MRLRSRGRVVVKQNLKSSTHHTAPLSRPYMFTFEYTVWVCVIDSSGGCREMTGAVIKHLMYQGLLGSRIIDAGDLAVLLACDSCDSDIRYLD